MTTDKIDERRDLNIRVRQASGGIADSQYGVFKDITRYFLDALGPAKGVAENAMKSNVLARSRSAALSMRAVGQQAALLDQTMNMFQSTQPMMTSDGPVYPNVSILKDRLVTHNADGSLNRIFSNDVRDRFKQGDQTNWPQLILTTNHALCTDHTHVSGIMRGFRKLAMDTFDLPLNLMRHPDKPERDPSYNRAGNGASRSTMIISAVDAEPNAWLNGAELLDRLAALREEYEENMAHGKGGRALQTEANMSPGSRRLAKFMLRLMVEDNDLNRINPFGTKLTGAQERADTPGTAHHNPLAPDNDGQEPIVLRADAEVIAQHIKLAGYSKGGNTVSDAMRYLVKELRQTKSDGTPLFHIRDAKHPDKTHAVKKERVANIVRNIGLLCVATGEVPLTHEEKEFGIRRLSIINENDLIANHFRAGDEHRYGTHDDFLVIKGSKDHLGHGPKEALGFYEEEGEDSKGALHEDPSVHNRLRNFFASMFDKVAVSDLVILPATAKHGAEIEIELGAGAAIQDKKIKKHVDHLIGSISTALEGAPLKLALYTDLNTRSLRIRQWDDKTPLSGEAMTHVVEALYKALDDLKKDGKNNIVVSNNVFGAVEEYRAHLVDHTKGDGKPDSFAQMVEGRRAHVGRIAEASLAASDRIAVGRV